MNELDTPPRTPEASRVLSAWHRDAVDEVRRAVAEHDVVVVGMGWNPHVRRARRALDDAGVAYTYLQYGTYLSGWRVRLAIKLWSGWPTFPQVFVGGTLVGGASDLIGLLGRGGLEALVAAPR